jgi:BMFP domain-containing protein YqiC
VVFVTDYITKIVDRAHQLQTVFGLSVDEAIAEAKEELRAAYESPLSDALEASRREEFERVMLFEFRSSRAEFRRGVSELCQRGYTAADSVRPERLWTTRATAPEEPPRHLVWQEGEWRDE